MRISDWSSDVCSSDLPRCIVEKGGHLIAARPRPAAGAAIGEDDEPGGDGHDKHAYQRLDQIFLQHDTHRIFSQLGVQARSEEHTSELQSLMRISYAVFCLKKTTKKNKHNTDTRIKVQQTRTY